MSKYKTCVFASQEPCVGPTLTMGSGVGFVMIGGTRGVLMGEWCIGVVDWTGDTTGWKTNISRLVTYDMPFPAGQILLKDAVPACGHLWQELPQALPTVVQQQISREMFPVRACSHWPDSVTIR